MHVLRTICNETIHGNLKRTNINYTNNASNNKLEKGNVEIQGEKGREGSHSLR